MEKIAHVLGLKKSSGQVFRGLKDIENAAKQKIRRKKKRISMEVVPFVIYLTELAFIVYSAM